MIASGTPCKERIFPTLRIVCRMNVQNRFMQIISSPGTPTIFQTRIYLQSHRRIFYKNTIFDGNIKKSGLHANGNRSQESFMLRKMHGNKMTHSQVSFIMKPCFCIGFIFIYSVRCCCHYLCLTFLIWFLNCTFEEKSCALFKRYFLTVPKLFWDKKLSCLYIILFSYLCQYYLDKNNIDFSTYLYYSLLKKLPQ